MSGNSLLQSTAHQLLVRFEAARQSDNAVSGKAPRAAVDLNSAFGEKRPRAFLDYTGTGVQSIRSRKHYLEADVSV
ncbi:MAG: hypothetical protein ACYCXP_11800 [Leptospirillum sp.]